SAAPIDGPRRGTSFLGRIATYSGTGKIPRTSAIYICADRSAHGRHLGHRLAVPRFDAGCQKVQCNCSDRTGHAERGTIGAAGAEGERWRHESPRARLARARFKGGIMRISPMSRIVLIGVSALAIGNALAQTYPSKPVRIVTFNAGGANDVLARL